MPPKKSQNTPDPIAGQHEIRALVPRDYDELILLWVRAGLPFRPKGRDSRETIAAQMAAKPQLFLGAYERGRLVGSAILSYDLRKGWINRLAVDPGYRRRGVAETLIAESERTLRQLGVIIFCALVEDGNTASKGLFRKCGYVEHRDIVYFSKRDSGEV